MIYDSPFQGFMSPATTSLNDGVSNSFEEREMMGQSETLCVFAEAVDGLVVCSVVGKDGGALSKVQSTDPAFATLDIFSASAKTGSCRDTASSRPRAQHRRKIIINVS